MFFINFLKSLVIPKYMARFKSMSVFFAIAIFFVASFILAVPQLTNINKARYELVDVQNAYYLQVFANIDDEDLDTLRETSFEIGKSGLLFDESITKGDVFTYDFESKSSNSNDFVRIVFDTFDVGNLELKPNPDVLNDFEALPKPVDGNKFLLIFYGNSIIYYNPLSMTELKYIEPLLVFSELESGHQLSYYLMDAYIPKIKNQISFNTFISCVVFTLIIVLILWLFLRSSGSSFTFKELYNIGSIAMIVPIVVFFIASWFLYRFDIMSYFSSFFGIYYLIMMLIINSKRKIA